MSKVKRAGEYFVQGAIDMPLPRVEIDGIGIVSFPVPPEQIARIIAQAERAPYGRGEETIHDTSVRKVWQLAPGTVRITGKSWENAMQVILDRVSAGLGRPEGSTSAEFYKLLIYDPGAFFTSHRDTEEADHMFGTLVVNLPSPHAGGDLIIRHAGREAIVRLSGADLTELAFAAFYADCEHEVRPVTTGHRVCLIYNLIQGPSRQAGGASLKAPHYDAEIAAASRCLEAAFAAANAPRKIVWLLEHQYSPDGLAFSALKNADAARAKVLAQAAETAGCVAHLGLVHIEENGPAEPRYQPYDRYRRRSRWDYSEPEVDENADFEIVEISDGRQYIDHWIDPEDRDASFGEIPLGENELLPKGALDNEKPDQQRLTEATGNEGASFERSYHRAALVIWPRTGFASVLLQSGVGAVMPIFKKLVATAAEGAGDTPARQEALALADRILEEWQAVDGMRSFRHGADFKKPDRVEMLRSLGQLKAVDALERFLSDVVTRDYDGTENAVLATQAPLLGPARTARALAAVCVANMQWLHGPCVDLFERIVRKVPAKDRAVWLAELRPAGAAMVEGLGLATDKDHARYSQTDWQRAEKAKPIEAKLVADTLDLLADLETQGLRKKATAHFIAREDSFAPDIVLVPALTMLVERHGEAVAGDQDFGRLWRHTAKALLARSAHPPVAPTDWRQKLVPGCNCEHCRALQTFAENPVAQVGRFKVREDLRFHLESRIRSSGLDMSCLTEKGGSPKALVCTKNRHTYDANCARYTSDIRRFGELAAAIEDSPGHGANLLPQLRDAEKRAAKWSPSPEPGVRC